MAVADRRELTGQPEGTAVAQRLRTHIVRFAAVGATTTVLNLGLFAVLRMELSSQAANLLALVVATVVNTYLNRVWTFGRPPGAGSAAREQALGMLGSCSPGRRRRVACPDSRRFGRTPAPRRRSARWRSPQRPQRSYGSWPCAIGSSRIDPSADSAPLAKLVSPGLTRSSG